MRTPFPFALLALVLGACSSTSEPSNRLTTLAGTWATQDTFRYHFTWASDTSLHMTQLINAYHISITAIDDSTFTMQVDSGTQDQLDSIVGTSEYHVVVPVGSLARDTIRVRGDTAYSRVLIDMPLSTAQDDVIHEHRNATGAPCLAMVWPVALASAPTTCVLAHHWRRRTF